MGVFFIGKYLVLLSADQKSFVIFRIQTMLLFASALLSVTLIAFGFSIVIVVASSNALLLLDVLF